jgi:signal transduction histidine kinase
MSGGFWQGLVMPARAATWDAEHRSMDSWRPVIVALDAAFAAVIGLAALDVAFSRQQVPWADAIGLIALGLLVAAYLAMGRSAIAARRTRFALVYLCVLVVVLAALSWSVPDALFVFFVAYTQVWFIVGRPAPGVFWTVALFLISTAGVGAHIAYLHGSVFGAVTNQSVGVLFSVLFGLWVLHVIADGEAHARTARELVERTAELTALHHERGVLAERERLAREVHDTLAQGYTSIVMLAQTASVKIESAPEVARERLALIEEVARENLGEARAVVAAFAPVAMEGATLRDALERLADRFSRETGIDVSVRLEDSAALLRRDEEVVLLRAAQEALTNVRRHASADHVELRLERDTAGWTVRVSDDGVGFLPERLGAGLTGLRRRMELANGSLEIQSTLGTGSEVTARIPQ